MSLQEGMAVLLFSTVWNMNFYSYNTRALMTFANVPATKFRKRTQNKDVYGRLSVRIGFSKTIKLTT